MTEFAASQPEFDPFEQIIVAHAHHWMIGPQDGPSSEGICKSCGETRDFTNAYSRTYRSPMYIRRLPRSQAPGSS